jgi:hypothetical protein
MMSPKWRNRDKTSSKDNTWETQYAHGVTVNDRVGQSLSLRFSPTVVKDDVVFILTCNANKRKRMQGNKKENNSNRQQKGAGQQSA